MSFLPASFVVLDGDQSRTCTMIILRSSWQIVHACTSSKTDYYGLGVCTFWHLKFGKSYFTIIIWLHLPERCGGGSDHWREACSRRFELLGIQVELDVFALGFSLNIALRNCKLNTCTRACTKLCVLFKYCPRLFSTIWAWISYWFKHTMHYKEATVYSRYISRILKR